MASPAFFLVILSLLAVACGQGTGALRLYRNGLTSSSYGILEIYYNDWGNICNDFYFTGVEADVACHQLGYSGSSTYGSSGTTSYGPDSRSTVIDNVNCLLSSYLALLQCYYSTVVSSSCTDDTDVYVSCYSTRIWNNPYSGQIRLTGGSYAGQGLLEVYCNGQWGTVCDDNFGSTDANVACKQLGYSSNYNYDHLSITGTSSQPIWLTNVFCSSSAADYISCLATCGSTCPSSQVSNCGHSEDVTLECEISSSYSAPSTTLSTCQYADSVYTISSSLAAIVAAVVIVSIIICILIITIPLCICCCLGVGIGAAFNSGRRQRATVVTTQAQPNTVVVSSDTSMQQLPPPPYGYAPTPATGYTKHEVYPPPTQI